MISLRIKASKTASDKMLVWVVRASWHCWDNALKGMLALRGLYLWEPEAPWEALGAWAEQQPENLARDLAGKGQFSSDEEEVSELFSREFVARYESTPKNKKISSRKYLCEKLPARWRNFPRQ